MAPSSSVPHLVNFLRAALSPAQIAECIAALQAAAPQVQTLDPEAGPARPSPKVMAEKPAIRAPQGLDALLSELEEAYSEAKFPPPTQQESIRMNDVLPGLSKRIAAFQGRQLVKMLRERLGL